MIDWLQPLIPGIDLAIIASYLLVVFVVVAFFREWGTPDVVALAAMGIILLLGLLPISDVVENDKVVRRGLLGVFSNGAPITIACMFVLSAGLERTGAIAAIGRLFTRIAGDGEVRVLIILMLLAAPLSAFVNNTPVVVVFLPIVLAHARNTKLHASRLLMPLSFAAILGGTCTLTGSSTNLIIDAVAQDYEMKAFTMFELAKLGVIYALVGFVYLLTIGRKLLPERHGLAELIEPDTRLFLTQFSVQKESPLIGKPLTDTLLKNFSGAEILEVRRKGIRLRSKLDELAIKEGDRLSITVHGPGFALLHEQEGILFEGQDELNLKPLETREMKLIEGIIGPHSKLVGRSVNDIGFRRNHGINILAIHRQGKNISRDFSNARLAFGDTLLMEGPADALGELQRSRDFVTLTEPPEITVRPRKIWIGAGVTLAFVLGASFQILPIVALAMLAALLMILFRCVTARQAYEAVHWDIVFLIFGMLTLGLTLEQTGGAQVLVDGLMSAVGDFSPFVVLAVVYLLSSTLTELISNTAVAALLTPIVIGVAESLGVDARPFVVAMMFGCSASFATPVGYQTNTYVYGAGGYKFTDFPKVGVPLNLILWLIATVLIPVFWPF